MFDIVMQSWASPQIRNCGLTKKVADLRTLAVEIADLRLRTIFNFSPQFRKFYTNIEIPFYFCKILMFLPSNCNCNYILFTKLTWPGDSEMTFRSSSQAATCPSVYHTRWRLHTVPLIAERQAGKL